ncbi:MFS general substrate transporter [Cryphonectria parasitica EP155]|uniref:MFS general substrate transporter n=1 Tax=Cryphonectria parasitica (strain ATCC 38755 / EP155) TaxID=660469 RepID=A0A9P5CQW5_CRYP1|nr:MFS general substrate transporter [Cryphonectria parasitica EP155]KAF3766505.1 MFS general substrate transporter [Cryphonectria parasitica EP155]
MAEHSSQLRRREVHLEQRNFNDRAIIEGPLAHLSDKELQKDVKEFSRHLPGIEYEQVLRAARVAKNIRTYDEVAKNMATETNLLVALNTDEKQGLVSEQQNLRGQFRQIFPVALTVGCAAFLQGHVQASINCSSLYAKLLLSGDTPDLQHWLQFGELSPLQQWKLGAMNAMPFFAAAVIGTPSALLFNYWIGRRGAITVAASLILASSLGSVWTTTWWQLLCVRIVNGFAMGIKAVSAPILASEIASTQWRGSSILMWQLWVAFGIATGSVFNLAIANWCNALGASALPENQRNALRQILGAPFVPSIILLVALCWCIESPRYYMLPNTPRFNVLRAYEILLSARETQLQALRDLYLIHKSVELDEYQFSPPAHQVDNLTSGFYHSLRQYWSLFTVGKLQNAVLSTCVVALAQQLCGINVFAFYSSEYLDYQASNTQPTDPARYEIAMGLSAGFGAINFLFGLLAIKRIDTWGRRKLMLITLPLMSIFLAAAALTFVNWNSSHLPALVGCAVAISVNLFFAGVLTLCYPALDTVANHWGGLVLFSGLNMVAFVLVFLLVEETKGFSLEDLSVVFAVPKIKLVKFQLGYLGYLWRKYALRSKEDEPEFYTFAFMESMNVENLDEDSDDFNEEL